MKNHKPGSPSRPQRQVETYADWYARMDGEVEQMVRKIGGEKTRRAHRPAAPAPASEPEPRDLEQEALQTLQNGFTLLSGVAGRIGEMFGHVARLTALIQAKGGIGGLTATEREGLAQVYAAVRGTPAMVADFRVAIDTLADCVDACGERIFDGLTDED